MKRELQGSYVTISTVGEKVQSFLSAPLLWHTPIGWTPTTWIFCWMGHRKIGRGIEAVLVELQVENTDGNTASPFEYREVFISKAALRTDLSGP